MKSVPIIDLTPWFHGDAGDREKVAAQVDTALREIGFLLVTGHGVPAELRAEVRAAAKRFFALPYEVKNRYRNAGQCSGLQARVKARAGVPARARACPDLPGVAARSTRRRGRARRVVARVAPRSGVRR